MEKRIKDLIEDIEVQTGDRFKKKDVSDIVHRVINTLADYAKNGDGFAIPGFGSTRYAEVAEREVRNPQTGEAMVSPAHRKIVFKFSKDIRDSVK